MRIAYITSLRLPSERAYGHQVAAVCGALATLGHDVTILSPERQNPISVDFHTYHRVSPQVQIQYISAFEGIASKWLPGVFGLWAHIWSFTKHLKETFPSLHADLLYTRNPVLLPVLLSHGTPVICELHTLPRFRRAKMVRLFSRCAVVVCLTTPMRNELVSWGVPEQRVIVAPDSVDATELLTLPDSKEARKNFSIPESAFVLGYAGSLSTMGIYKGVDVIIDALRTLPESVHVLIAGGPHNVVREFQAYIKAWHLEHRVTLLGQIPHGAVASVYAASDVLVYPAPKSTHPYFMRDTSPLKLLEYMAAGKPIVCADIPPVHDLLTAEEAVFFVPGNSASLVASITEIMNNRAGANTRAESAQRSAKESSWETRMSGILTHL